MPIPVQRSAQRAPRARARLARALEHAAACGLAAWSLGTAAGPGANPPTPKRDAYLEIHSLNEAPRDVINLLVPFFAKLNFTERVRKTDTQTGTTTTSFVGSNGDFVGITGRPGCLAVALYTSRHPIAPVSLGVRERSIDFREQLKGFLAGLPTPRPTAAEIVPDGAPCVDSRRWRNR